MNKDWSLYNAYKSKVVSIIGGNLLANIPRSIFTGVLYLFVLNISLPILNGTYEFKNLEKYYYVYLIGFIFYIIFSIIGKTNSFSKSYTIGSDVRLKLGEKLKKLSQGFFKTNDPGDVTSRMLHDVNKAEEILAHTLPDLIAAITVPFSVGAFLFYLNVKLTTILFIATFLSTIAFLVAKKIIKVMGKKHLEVINRASSRILEYSTSIKPLKSYDMIGNKYKKLDQAMIDLKKISFEQEFYAAIPVQIAVHFLELGYLWMLFTAVKMVIIGTLTIPTLISFAVIGFYFFDPIKLVGISIVSLRYANNSADRIKEIFLRDEQKYDKNHDLPNEHNIKFENVSFKYHDEYVLKGINCEMKEKSMTALVGLSGSGKSTITNLIARFWDVTEGKISYGGKDLSKINPEKLITNISMVFQDVFLFNDTIKNNIKVGKMAATDVEIIKAAKLANCHEFIMNMENGYDSMVSEGGKSLSGGQRQRISIARAILKDTPIILLDEATASLDPENENDIQQAINNLVKNKTLIVIAHKFNSIINADQILVLNNGVIEQKGVHDDLINIDGLYRNLWEAQQKAGTWKMKK